MDVNPPFEQRCEAIGNLKPSHVLASRVEELQDCATVRKKNFKSWESNEQTVKYVFLHTSLQLLYYTLRNEKGELLKKEEIYLKEREQIFVRKNDTFLKNKDKLIKRKAQ